MLGRGTGGQSHTHGLVQGTVEEEGGHAHRQGGGVQVEALVYLGREGQTRREEESDEGTHQQGHADAGQVEANYLRMGIADHQVRDQGGDAGGEEHGIDVGAEFLLLHQAVQPHTENAGPQVQNVDAPYTEAGGQDHHQGGGIVGCAPENQEEAQADGAEQTHVQKGGGIAAQGEIAGGELAGLGHDLPQSGDHLVPVRHEKGGDEEESGPEGKQQLQEASLG